MGGIQADIFREKPTGIAERGRFPGRKAFPIGRGMGETAVLSLYISEGLSIVF